jgi:sterol desaturase/sphingolipid hydroxylase (fatty acid hydroxylase superfamily)
LEIRLQHYLLSFGIAVVLATWITAAIGAAFTYRFQTGPGPKSLRGFLQFCFPGTILRHPSCRLDVMFIALGQLIPGRLFVPFMVSNVGVTLLCYGGLTRLFGPQTQHAAPLWLAGLLLVATVVIHDFMTFYAHYLQHKLPVLWELHKVHHSAEFLLPITNRRFHPVQGFVDQFANAAGIGVFLGVSAYVLRVPPGDTSFLGLDSYFLLNLASFYHLRHSHIPMRYGWLERHVISPAQHQLHHSRETRHWDRNFGQSLAWWDRMFGTLIYSDPNERYTMGLPHEIQHDYASAMKLYFVPMRNIAAMAWRQRRHLPALAGDRPATQARPAAR